MRFNADSKQVAKNYQHQWKETILNKKQHIYVNAYSAKSTTLPDPGPKALARLGNVPTRLCLDCLILTCIDSNKRPFFKKDKTNISRSCAIFWGMNG